MTATLGILQIPTTIPLHRGDAGHPQSYPFPVQRRLVAAVTVGGIVSGPRDRVLPHLVVAARALADDGVGAIAGDCGTLLRFQADVAAAVSIPVLLSPLLQVSLAANLIGRDRTVGILAANAANVPESAVAVPGRRVHLHGMQDAPTWRTSILEESGAKDAVALEAELLSAARRLIAAAGDLGAIVLDCADMPPYARALRRASGLPVFDALTLAGLAHAAIAADD
jgi:Asp/Glu/hydantoin racemase